MIDRNELLAVANATGLTATVVEKDYILGWLLRGISQHEELRERWLFKGGTCLKKCYFETYRFSEDLDFTLLRAAHIDAEFLQAVFAEVATRIYDEAGIEMPAESMRFDVYQNPRLRRSSEPVRWCSAKVDPRGFTIRPGIARRELREGRIERGRTDDGFDQPV